MHYHCMLYADIEPAPVTICSSYRYYDTDATILINFKNLGLRSKGLEVSLHIPSLSPAACPSHSI